MAHLGQALTLRPKQSQIGNLRCRAGDSNAHEVAFSVPEAYLGSALVMPPSEIYRRTQYV